MALKYPEGVSVCLAGQQEGAKAAESDDEVVHVTAPSIKRKRPAAQPAVVNSDAAIGTCKRHRDEETAQDQTAKRAKLVSPDKGVIQLD